MNNFNVNIRGSYAGFVTRMVAFVLDLIFIAVSVSMVNWLFRTMLSLVSIDPDACPPLAGQFSIMALICNISDWALLVFSASFPFLYLIFFWVVTGQTPAKYILGVRIVSWNGGRVTLVRAILRLIGYGLSILTFGYGFLRVMFDERRRGLHDQIAGTSVIFYKDTMLNVHFLEHVNDEIKTMREKIRQLRHPHQSALAASTTGTAPASAPAAAPPEPVETNGQKTSV